MNYFTFSLDPSCRRLFLLVSSFLIGLSALFYQTGWTMVSTWISSETFTHGFLIIPISLWMVWGRKTQLQNIPIVPELKALVLLTIFGFSWMLAHLVDVLVMQQYALVCMLISGLVAILGTRFCKEIAFPLGYLLFLVPAGEVVVPILMEYTATFTVAMIKLTGIPVYREGMFIYLPSGNWSVVQACSGVRYLIASVTLGCLFAYMNYSSLRKRLLFILISAIVPIVANGIRAYMIVMIGHLSDMKLATGVDHLIYGWIFFGVVMLVLFTIGSIWRDDTTNVSDQKVAATIKERSMPKVSAELAGIIGEEQEQERIKAKQGSSEKTLLMALLIISIWPVFAYLTDSQNNQTVYKKPLVAPESEYPIIEPQWQWFPPENNADNSMAATYSTGNQVFGVYLYQYLSQEQGAELVDSQNILLKKAHRKTWKVIASHNRTVQINNTTLDVNEIVLKGPEVTLLVWYWYRVGDNYTNNRYIAKGLEAWQKITFKRKDGARIFTAMPMESELTQPKETVAQYQLFLQSILPSIESSLDIAAGKQ